MNKCLIFGGGGFIGRHLVERLLILGYSVRIFERSELKLNSFSAKIASQVEWIYGDFTNLNDIENAVRDCNVIFHLISTTLPKKSNDNPLYDIETNLISSIQLMQIAVRCKVYKLIFLSSGGTVYGIPTVLPIPESHATNPICSYGIVKLAIEKYLYLFKKNFNLNYLVLRLSNPYGKGQKTSSNQGLISTFLDKALKGETIEVWGDGSIVRDYIHVCDVVSALVKSINYKGTFNLFNIGSGQGMSINEVILEIEKCLGFSLKIEYSASRAFDVPANIMDISLAKRELQWQPVTSLQCGIQDILQALNENYDYSKKDKKNNLYI